MASFIQPGVESKVKSNVKCCEWKGGMWYFCFSRFLKISRRRRLMAGEASKRLCAGGRWGAAEHLLHRRRGGEPGGSDAASLRPKARRRLRRDGPPVRHPPARVAHDPRRYRRARPRLRLPACGMGMPRALGAGARVRGAREGCV